jgi:SAM-dependent methyltransferase
MHQATRERIVATLRATGLLQAYNEAKFVWLAARTAGGNAAFRREHPDEAFPPLRLAYDAYGHIGLRDYHASGLRHAEFVAGLIRKHAGPGSQRVLEWGCGPARVIRHLPALLGPDSTCVGTDYNPATISWCRANIPGIRFEPNELQPPLSLDAGSIDAAYALSVFTHLSEAMHVAWRDELLRVLKPGGFLIATTHGAWYRERHLLPAERADYDAGRLVVRGSVREGKKWFAAFHPPAWVRGTLLKSFDILDHQASPLPNSIEQDVWVARKNG